MPDLANHRAMRLTSLDQVPEGLRPGYDPACHGVGIVHLGLGAFHKAHQAALTDLALAATGGDWRILGVSLRSGRAARKCAVRRRRARKSANG